MANPKAAIDAAFPSCIIVLSGLAARHEWVVWCLDLVSDWAGCIPKSFPFGTFGMCLARVLPSPMRGFSMRDIQRIKGKGYFFYNIPTFNSCNFYETEIIRDFQDALHLLAHLSSKTWMDEAKLKQLAIILANDLKAWK